MKSIRQLLASIARAWAAKTFRLQRTIKRAKQSWAYFRDSLTSEQGLEMLCEIESAARLHSLISLSRDDVLTSALERWAPHPELANLAAEATREVANNFESYDDTRSNAEAEALDKIKEWAESWGIDLKPLEEAPEEESDETDEESGDASNEHADKPQHEPPPALTAPLQNTVSQPNGNYSTALAFAALVRAFRPS